LPRSSAGTAKTKPLATTGGGLSVHRTEEAGAGVQSPATPYSEPAPDGAEVHSQGCEPLGGTMSRVVMRPERSTVRTSGGAGGASVAPPGAFPEGEDRWRPLSPGVCTPGYGLPPLRGSGGKNQSQSYRSTQLQRRLELLVSNPNASNGRGSHTRRLGLLIEKLRNEFVRGQDCRARWSRCRIAVPALIQVTHLVDPVPPNRNLDSKQ
jgi:hypothetical protein